jgi:hypothetical protein
MARTGHNPLGRGTRRWLLRMALTARLSEALQASACAVGATNTSLQTRSPRGYLAAAAVCAAWVWRARSWTSLTHVHDVGIWSGWQKIIRGSTSSTVSESIFTCERWKGDGWPSKGSAILVSTSSGRHGSGRASGALRSRRPSPRDSAATGGGLRGRTRAVSRETASGRSSRAAPGAVSRPLCRLPVLLLAVGSAVVFAAWVSWSQPMP